MTVADTLVEIAVVGASNDIGVDNSVVVIIVVVGNVVVIIVVVGNVVVIKIVAVNNVVTGIVAMDGQFRNVLIQT